MKLSFVWSLVWGFLVALVFLNFHTSISGYFEDDQLVTQYAGLYLMIVPVSYGAWGILMMASATFNSLGRPLVSTFMSVVRMFVIYVPLAYIGQLYWGVGGIFGAAALSNAVMGLIGYIWNRRTYALSKSPK